MRSHLLPAAVALLATVACQESLGPDRGDPAEYAFSTAVSFACGSWFPSQPATSLGLFDVELARNDGDLDDGPSRNQLRSIVRSGGTVIHSFHVDMVRAILPLAAVPALGASRVRGVTAPHDLTVRVFVGFHGAIDGSAILDLGGVIASMFGQTVVAVLPDAAIPVLRRRPSIRYVEQVGSGCLLASQA